MSANLESRMNRLEKQNRFLKGAFALLAITGITVAAASPEFGSTLTLKSPNGKNVITLEAKNDISGIWIHRGVDNPMVALYNDSRQGAVVGVYGNHTKLGIKAMDGGISAGADGSNEAHLQSVDINGDIATTPLSNLIKQNSKPQ